VSNMTLEQARPIVEASIKHKAVAAMPGTDAEIISVANQVLGACLTAYGTGTRSDPVMDVLFAAQVQPTDTHDYADVYQRQGQQPPARPQAAQAPQAAPVPAAFGAVPAPAPAPVAQQAAAPAPAPVQQQPPAPAPAAFSAPQPIQAGGDAASAPPAQAAPGGGGIDSIFPGYDDLKARDIVEAVKANAASGDLTPQEWEQIRAYEAANEGRKTIVELQPVFAQPAPPPVAVPPAQVPPAPTITQGPAAGGYSIEAAYADGSLGQVRARQEAIPEPPRWQGGEPVLPVDITLASPEDLSRLAMQFNSLFARTTWLLSQEEGRARACAHLEGDYHRVAYTTAFEHLKAQVEKVTASALTEVRQQATLAADGDATVKKWRDLKVQHEIECRDLKARIAGYESTIDRLSREQSRRERIAGAPGQG
jgi:hypothetical protein